MKRTLILFIASFVSWPTVLSTAAQEPAATQKTAGGGTAKQTERPKNEVERAVEEAAKRGEKIIGGCLQDCDDVDDAVLKGKILALPPPAYPPIARVAHVSGGVKVHVIIDTDGKVIAAAAVEGHPLLQPASVAAARQAVFSPVLYEGKPVKVMGLIKYNFVPQ